MKRTGDVLCALACALAAFACYFGTHRYGIVNIDDYDYLVGAKAITGGLSADGLDWALRSVDHAIWMPATWTSYMLDFTLFGPDCWGAMHMHNAALHALNAALLYLFLRLLLAAAAGARAEDAPGRQRTGSPFRPWRAAAMAGTLLWALHPLRVESVAWLASRKDVLSLAFKLCALVCWTKASMREKEDEAFKALHISAIAAFVLGAMAKPSVMTYPLLQLCVDAFIVRRVRPRMYIAPAAIACIVGVEAAYAQSAGGATGMYAGMPVWARLLNAASAFGTYLSNTFLPGELAPQCTIKYPAMPRGWIAGTALSAAAAVFAAAKIRGILAKRRSRTAGADWIGAGVLWFCIGIGPFLGIANFGYHAFADRFTYIPAIGVSIAAAGLLLAAASREGRAPSRPTRRSALPASAAALACAFAAAALLGAATVRQTRIWRSDKAMWEATLRVDGDDNAAAHCGLGMEAWEMHHDIATACQEFERVRQIYEPAYWFCAQMHVYALCEEGKTDEAFKAVEWLRENAVRMKADFGNRVFAELAFAVAYEPKREWAREKLERMAARGKTTPSLAYLTYRLGVETQDAAMRERGLEELAKCEKTDYMQFRWLTSKQKKGGKQ